jgi:hypothetical protein
MSLLDFINVLLGNYQPAFISFFNNIDEDGYPVEEDWFEDDDVLDEVNDYEEDKYDFGVDEKDEEDKYDFGVDDKDEEEKYDFGVDGKDFE